MHENVQHKNSAALSLMKNTGALIFQSLENTSSYLPYCIYTSLMQNPLKPQELYSLTSTDFKYAE